MARYTCHVALVPLNAVNHKMDSVQRLEVQFPPLLIQTGDRVVLERRMFRFVPGNRKKENVGITKHK